MVETVLVISGVSGMYGITAASFGSNDDSAVKILYYSSKLMTGARFPSAFRIGDISPKSLFESFNSVCVLSIIVMLRNELPVMVGTMNRTSEAPHR